MTTLRTSIVVGVLDFDYRTELDGTLQDALDVSVEYGVELVPADLPEPKRDPYPNFDEFPSSLAAYLAREPTAPSGAWARIVGSGASPKGPSTRAYQEAVAARMAYRRDLAAFMDRRDLDAVAYPVSSTTASAGRLFGQDDELGPFNCAPAAVAGLPALAIPAGFASDGLPVGLELLGRAFDEATLISIAAGFEAHTDHRRLPSTTPPLDVAP